MSLQVQLTYVTPTPGAIRVGFNLVKIGSYVTAVGGDTVDFTASVAASTFVGSVPAIESLGAPLSFDAWDVSGNIATGVIVTPKLGTTQANSKVLLQSSLNTEQGSGAYPAITLVGEAVFNRL